MNNVKLAIQNRTEELVKEFEECLDQMRAGANCLPEDHEFRTFQCWICEKLASLELLIATHHTFPDNP
ncbi:hypothetical protein LCGC14_2091090 [marine sediment metagenome]|uniref:Uncharacterized protein n=1 Tax=marine sediment metagenome TaxID=412755 RepID=A0A0F9ECN4_9ZZZZ